MIVSVKEAAKLIQSGNVVGLPTETVYGLAADASNIKAVKKIFELKQRPADNPLIVHISSIDQAEDLAVANSKDFRELANAFWPGPLTIVLPKKPIVLDIITAGLDTVAIRMPNHPDMLSAINQSGPVAAPSANRSGKPSPTRPDHVEEDFGKEFPVVDGGECSIGIESTVLDLTSDEPVILRPGFITKTQIESVLKKDVLSETSGDEELKRSPGTRYSHYKPAAKVQWLKDSVSVFPPNSLYIYHTKSPQPKLKNVINFRGNFEEFARSLYDLYRTADKKKFTSIYIEPLPEDDRSPLLPALTNRIQRSIS